MEDYIIVIYVQLVTKKVITIIIYMTMFMAFITMARSIADIVRFTNSFTYLLTHLKVQNTARWPPIYLAIRLSCRPANRQL